MNHTNRLQHFALDANGNIIDINETEGIEDKQYFCPHCHNEMIAKRGDIRQWHFAHKTDKCSYDKYLHSIAEIMIMDWFNKAESITLIMNVYEKCKKYDNCRFCEKDICRRKNSKEYDLKRYYSQCIKEKEYGGFVADLLCERNNKEEDTMFIEIFVTHECSREKINSGIHIIEIPIKSEEDILNIINSSTLKEGETVRLYNFNRKETYTKNFEQSFQKYILNYSSKSYVDKERYTCKNYDTFHRGIYEISMPYDDCIPYFINSGGLYVVGKALAYTDGYLKKDCQLCYWQAIDFVGDNFCKLYKKCGNPKYCRDNDSSKCSMFSPDKRVIDDAVSNFKEYVKHAHVDVWKAEQYK